MRAFTDVRHVLSVYMYIFPVYLKYMFVLAMMFYVFAVIGKLGVFGMIVVVCLKHVLCCRNGVLLGVVGSKHPRPCWIGVCDRSLRQLEFQHDGKSAASFLLFLGP